MPPLLISRQVAPVPVASPTCRPTPAWPPSTPRPEKWPSQASARPPSPPPKPGDTTYSPTTASYTLIVTAPPTFGSAIIADQDYTVRHAVNFTLPAATGGTTPLSYSLTPGGSIPAGLSFNADDLVLVGTLTTAAAAITLTYTVTDSTTPTPATAFQTFTVTVAKGEQAGFSFATATVNRIVGNPAFTEAVSGGSGEGAVTYASGDTRVASVNADSGEVTILVVGTSTITATKAADDNYNVATASYTLIVTATPAPPTFGSAIIADQDYTVRHAVNFTLPAATGGTTPLSYSLTPGGSIPAGLSFNDDDRVLVGTPTTAAAAITLTYTVTDSTTPTPATAFQTFTVTVAKGEQAGFSFATATVNRIVGNPAFTEAVSGGSGEGAVTYASGDTRVASVNADSGEVTILVVGTSTITATKAADDNYNVATASYTLIVTAAPTFGSASIVEQDYTVDTAVNVTLPAATDGTAPLSYSLTPGGSIPAGLSFNDDDRVLVGTPTTAAAAITLTYTVTDSTTPTPATAFQTFTVTVAKGEQAGFSFATATVNRIVGNPAFTEAVSGGSGDGAVTYRMHPATTVASVNADSGEVTIFGGWDRHHHRHQSRRYQLSWDHRQLYPDSPHDVGGHHPPERANPVARYPGDDRKHPGGGGNARRIGRGWR